MNRQSLKIFVVIFALVSCFVACKKTNSLNSYPTNQRLLSFTRTVKHITPGSIPYTETYRFDYNHVNQVSRIYYTSNNPSQTNTISTLEYHGNVIIDTITDINSGVTFEIDTFITDYSGNIDTTYMRGIRTAYGRVGNLLTRIDNPDYTYTVFTSYNDNFILGASSVGYFNTSYTFYTDQKWRIGDYEDLNAFARYGFNLYNTSSLVRSINSIVDSTYVTYTFDADSKITNIQAVKSDTFATILPGALFAHPFSDTEFYKLQYETITAY